jgi:phospholipid N-methyltransferase
METERAKAMAVRKTRARSLTSCLRFIRAGLVKHLQTGGIVPSQRFLIDKMIAPVPHTYRGQIIELGAGNGALTLRLGERCSTARILACELNPVLARDTRANLAAAGLNGRAKVLTDSAEHLLSTRLRRGLPKPDFIISGLPLGNLGRRRARELIDLIRRALAEGGFYIQFQHSLLDRKNIQACFFEVRIVPVLLNFPPAVVYYARRPLVAIGSKGQSRHPYRGIGLDVKLACTEARHRRR